MHCHNNCWDAVAAAGRDTAPSSYHHLTFNTTWQAGAMWCLVVVSTVALHEAVKGFIDIDIGPITPNSSLQFSSYVQCHLCVEPTMTGYPVPGATVEGGPAPLEDGSPLPLLSLSSLLLMLGTVQLSQRRFLLSTGAPDPVRQHGASQHHGHTPARHEGPLPQP